MTTVPLPAHLIDYCKAVHSEKLEKDIKEYGDAREAAVRAEMQAEITEYQETLQFVERWANHHGAKATMTPEEVLSCIQHYPPIKAITKGYADGKVPETRDPYAEIDALKNQEPSAYWLTQRHPELSRSLTPTPPGAVTEEDKAEYELSWEPLYLAAGASPKLVEAARKALTSLENKAGTWGSGSRELREDAILQLRAALEGEKP